MSNINELRTAVKGLPEGKLKGDDYHTVLSLLTNCWSELQKEDDSSMNAHKLYRAEELSFHPPATLSFLMERHGQTVLGSVYADLHEWSVDLESATAFCNKYYGKRVVGEKDKPLKVKPLVEEVANNIFNHGSKFVEWKSDTKVRVLISEIIPETVKQTTAERRKRFRCELEEIITSQGWKKTKAYNVYEKENED